MCMEWVSGRPFIQHGKKREVERGAEKKKKRKCEKRVIFNDFESEQLSRDTEWVGHGIEGVRGLWLCQGFVCVCVCVVSGGEERPAGKACSLPVCLPGTDDIRPGDRLHG